MVDKVKPLKFENATDGTEVDIRPTETDPTEDYTTSKGVAFENNDNQRIFGDAGTIKFEDQDTNNSSTIFSLFDLRNALTNAFSAVGIVATNVRDAIVEVFDRAIFADGTKAFTGDQSMGNNRLLDACQVVINPQQITTTLNGNTNLTGTDCATIYITGIETGYTLTLPNATTLENGTYYEIYNSSSQVVTLRNNDGTNLYVLFADSAAKVMLQTNGTQNGIWTIWALELGQATGITNEILTSQLNFQTSSTTDVQITSFSSVPVAGQYAIWFNADASSTRNNSLTYVTIYKDTTAIADSERVEQSVSSNFNFQITTQTTASFNGSEEVRVYVRTDSTSNTYNIDNRTLTLIRLGS